MSGDCPTSSEPGYRTASEFAISSVNGDATICTDESRIDSNLPLMMIPSITARKMVARHREYQQHLELLGVVQAFRERYVASC